MSGEKEKRVEQWIKVKRLGKESEILDRKIAEKGIYIEEVVKWIGTNNIYFTDTATLIIVRRCKNST